MISLSNYFTRGTMMPVLNTLKKKKNRNGIASPISPKGHRVNFGKNSF